MNITRHTRRLAAIVAIAASALLALATAAPAMAATASVPHYGQPVAPPAQVYTEGGGGMPGWQITLIAAAAAILAAIVAVAADRVLTARRHQTAPTI
jgi:hypothetical protein